MGDQSDCHFYCLNRSRCKSYSEILLFFHLFQTATLKKNQEHKQDIDEWSGTVENFKMKKIIITLLNVFQLIMARSLIKHPNPNFAKQPR